MNNRRDRLSADMKGTVPIQDGAKHNKESKISNKKEKQNDRPDDSIENSSDLNMNAEEEEMENSRRNDVKMESNRAVVVGDQERLQLDWRVSQWSRCSRTCGKEGKQVHNKDTQEMIEISHCFGIINMNSSGFIPFQYFLRQERLNASL